jgi:hypothetical protein
MTRRRISIEVFSELFVIALLLAALILSWTLAPLGFIED